MSDEIETRVEARAEWILVTLADHIPTPSGSSPPWKTYPVGFDPNDADLASEGLAYLPVVRNEPPADNSYNTVLYHLYQPTTIGTDGVMYQGRYEAPSWVVGWDTEPNTVEQAQSKKTYALNAARDRKVMDGFPIDGGNFILPLTDEAFYRVQSDVLEFEKAVNNLSISATTELLFTDLAGRKVPIGLESLKTHVTTMWLARKTLNDVYVEALNAISIADTPAEVDAVTWEF